MLGNIIQFGSVHGEDWLHTPAKARKNRNKKQQQHQNVEPHVSVNIPESTTAVPTNNRIDCGIVFAIINFVLELASAVFDQLASVHKLQYAIVSMSLSFVAMSLCIFELVLKCRKEEVTWEWRSILPWLYYPDGKPFGSFEDIIGLVFAICQCIFATINFYFACRHADNPVKIAFWPIVFALGLLCSKFLEKQLVITRRRRLERRE